MITFKQFLSEMAAPRDADRAKVYYHGTRSEAAAKSILSKGIDPGDIAAPEKHKVTKGPNLVPVKGKVYITPSLQYAQIYAIGGDMAGHDWKPDEDFGYVFEIKGSDLRDIQPDEDSVGEYICNAARELKRQEPWMRRLVYKSQELLTELQWKKLLQGDYTIWAHCGKKLLPHMSDEDKHRMIDLGAHVAHDGNLMPAAAYKIDLTKIKDLKRDGSNFFDHAEKIK